MAQLSFAREFSEKEAKVLESYLRLCARKGVDSVTLAELAKESELAFGTVHQFFGGRKREELPLCAAVHVARNAQEYTTRLMDQSSSREGGQGYDPLVAYVHAHFSWARNHEVHASFWVHHLYLTSIRSKLREINGTVIARSRKRIEALLFESCGRRNTPVSRPAERSAEIHALMIGGLTLGLSDPSPGALDREEKIVLGAIRALSAS